MDSWNESLYILKKQKQGLLGIDRNAEIRNLKTEQAELKIEIGMKKWRELKKGKVSIIFQSKIPICQYATTAQIFRFTLNFNKTYFQMFLGLDPRLLMVEIQLMYLELLNTGKIKKKCKGYSKAGKHNSQKMKNQSNKNVTH